MRARKYKRDCALEVVLTVAEERVLTLISQSMTNREAAHQLGTSPATLKRHLENILRKHECVIASKRRYIA